MSEPTKNKGGRLPKARVQLTITPSPKIADAMRRRAADLGLTVTAYVERLVRDDPFSESVGLFGDEIELSEEAMASSSAVAAAVLKKLGESPRVRDVAAAQAAFRKRYPDQPQTK
jgi:hypothetical protein